MTPRTAGALLSFIIIGFFGIFNAEMGTFSEVETAIVWSIFLSVASYYYLGMLADRRWNEIIGHESKFNWWLMVIQHALIFSTWFVLVNYREYFGFLIFVLYLTYLVWDIKNLIPTIQDALDVVKRPIESGKLTFVVSDFLGVLIYFGFAVILVNLPEEGYDESIGSILSAGMITAFVVVHSVVTMIAVSIVFDHNPFRMLSADGKPMREN
uniref:Uncharacterized protein n=1 Tax=Candidatus Kentrum sp. LPFa TaxID=2126335 RepID=A0A450VYD8_9GAMM|nr:MAG: hypothetical protein BECKLPF1236B_GA0070989_101116 [Candidatus Kentron sp. LPFa]